VKVLRNVVAVVVLIACLVAIVTHISVLQSSDLNPVSSPIGALALSDSTNLFKYGLWVFALGHFALVVLINRPGAGRFTRAAQVFLIINSILIVWLPLHFASQAEPELTMAAGNGPMWLLGGSVGFAMGLVAGSLWQQQRALAYFSLVCLLVWSLLAPVFIAIDPSLIGAYQRSVGALLIIWSAVVAMQTGFNARLAH